MGSNGVPRRAADMWPFVIRMIDGLYESVCVCVCVIPRKLIV